MARIEIIVEDAIGPDGDDGVEIRIESADPPIPIRDGTIDFHAATKSQCVAFGAVMEIAGLGNANMMVIEAAKEGDT